MRYFFHLRVAETLVSDSSGERVHESELLDMAIASARELLRSNRISVRSWLGMSYEIADPSGALVLSVPFTQALDAALE
jgi:hypothetical protein